MNPVPSLPFSKEVRDEALGYEPVRDPIQEFPDGLTEEKVARLHRLALDGNPAAVVELKQLVKRHPGVPFLKNYLSVALWSQGKHRDAEKVEKETLAAHPDYFFAKLAEAKRLIGKKKLDEAKALLGPSLRLADFSTSEPFWHFSHWENFYFTAATWYLGAGKLNEAQGLLEALRKWHANPESLDHVQRAIMMERLRTFHRRMSDAEAKEIRVKTAAIPRLKSDPGRPAFHHAEIESLYRTGVDFPKPLYDALLALPRETLVADLEKVIGDAVASGPWLYRRGQNDETTWFPLHAIFLLGEIGAHGSMPAVLRFLEQHPDLLDFWFGESISWEPLHALAGANLPLLGEWMKSPGIASRGKDAVTEAVGLLARHQPGKREEVIGWLGEVMDFFIGCPRDANVIDTRTISFLVSEAINQRATSLLPRIEALYAKGYVSEFIVGDLENVREDMAAEDSEDRRKALPMLAFYRTLSADDDQGSPEDAGRSYHELFGEKPAVAPAPSAAAGRNDPCPCGSGKKYKKCCL